MAQTAEPPKSKDRHITDADLKAEKEFDEEFEKELDEEFKKRFQKTLKERAREDTRKHRRTMGFILVDD